MKRAEQVVTIRVPAGLPEELRTLTGLPFATLARHVLVTLLNNERRRANQPQSPTPIKESPDV